MRKLTHLSLLALLLWASSNALGQSNYASLSGTVFDPQQKAIPGAAVQLTSDSTQASRSANSNELGLYQFTALLPGTYKLTKCNCQKCPSLCYLRVLCVSVVKMDVT